MANEIDFNLGTFDLDQTNNIAVEDISYQIAKNIQQNALPKGHGSVIPIGQRKTITAKVKGTIIGSDYDNLRSNLDSLKNALESTAEVKLTTDDDRYLNVQYQNFGCSFRVMRKFAEFSFDVVAGFPFWLAQALTSTSPAWTTATPFNLTYSNGNADARVKLTILAPGTPIVDDIKVENVTTGEIFMYRGTLAAAKSLIVNNRVDAVDMAVTNDGTSDWPNFYGDLLTLVPGVNSMKITCATAGMTPTFAYRETYK